MVVAAEDRPGANHVRAIAEYSQQRAPGTDLDVVTMRTETEDLERAVVGNGQVEFDLRVKWDQALDNLLRLVSELMDRVFLTHLIQILNRLSILDQSCFGSISHRSTIDPWFFLFYFFQFY